MLNDMNDLMVLIHINQIKRKQNAHGVDPAGRHDPKALIDLQPESSN
jgi:hypothetical protein